LVVLLTLEADEEEIFRSWRGRCAWSRCSIFAEVGGGDRRTVVDAGDVIIVVGVVVGGGGGGRDDQGDVVHSWK
jgi:hypothetical protein